MTSARHKRVVEPSWRRRFRAVGRPVAAAALSVGVVGAAVAAPHGAPRPVASPHPAVRTVVLPAAQSRVSIKRAETVSRFAERRSIEARVPRIVGHRWMTAPLNVWPSPRESGSPLTVLPAGGKVFVTGVRVGPWAQIVRHSQVRYVTAAYLVATRPKPAPATATAPAAPAGISYAPCPDGSATEVGLQPAAVRMFRAVCNAFPALTTYGGFSQDGGEHATGDAVDFMTNGNSALGQAVADWAVAHAAVLDVYDVIWEQHIWTPVRASEGWRLMPNRGSPTANHMDHVHICVAAC